MSKRFPIPMQIPHPPEEGWLLGSAPTMLRKDHHRALAAWSRQLGPVYAIRILFWHVRTSPLLLSVKSLWSVSHGSQYSRQALTVWPRQLGPA